MRCARSLLAVVLLSLAGKALAVAVRGRVDFVGPNGGFPMARASVQLCHAGAPNAGCLGYVTGQDGMYYFPNAVSGPHVLLVNGIQRLAVFIPNAPAFDIPPVAGN